MSEMKVVGKVIKIGDLQVVGQNNFQKRSLIVETIEQYPQKLELEFTSGNVNLLDNVGVGDSVDVSINLRGREWTNDKGEVKYFNTIQGWKIEVLTRGGNGNGNQTTKTGVGSGVPSDDDDLPF